MWANCPPTPHFQLLRAIEPSLVSRRSLACRAIAASSGQIKARLRFAMARQPSPSADAGGEGWWSRRVTLPHKLACKASALLVCHDPTEIGTSPWCCPKQTEFWRLGRASWRSTYEKIGAVTGNRTRTCSLAKSHSAVKSQPRK